MGVARGRWQACDAQRWVAGRLLLYDSARLASELAAAQAPGASLAIEASPEGEDEADGRAKAWRAHRRALAPLDSGLNADWDPQRPKSQRADKTKWTKLLAYYYAQTTEPEEAVRRAVSVIFGNPVTDESGTKLWVPGNYDAGTIKSVADTLLRQATGYEAREAASIWHGTSMANPLIGDALGTEIEDMPRRPAAIQTSSTLVGVDSREREEINRALRNKGAKLRRERLDSESLTSTPPKTPPGVDIDANIDEALKNKGNNRWFYRQVDDNGPWDYKRQGDEFEDFGNFNYGATGAALGYTEATLLRMAGWNHARNNTRRPQHGVAASLPGAYVGIGGMAPFGDDPKDQYWIRQGYRYYQERQ